MKAQTLAHHTLGNFVACNKAPLSSVHAANEISYAIFYKLLGNKQPVY